jgi:hypothetical protein
MLTVTGTGIKDFSLSQDGEEAITEHLGDIGVTLPTECLNNLRMPSERVASGGTSAGETPVGRKATADKVSGNPIAQFRRNGSPLPMQSMALSCSTKARQPSLALRLDLRRRRTCE